MHKSSVPKSKVKVLWLCSRSQPGIKVIIRDLRGHLLHTVTFLVQTWILLKKITIYPSHTPTHSPPNCQFFFSLLDLDSL